MKTNKLGYQLLKSIDEFPKLQDYLSNYLSRYSKDELRSIKILPDSGLVLFATSHEDRGICLDARTTTAGVYEGNKIYQHRIGSVVDEFNRPNRRGNRIILPVDNEENYIPYSKLKTLENTPKEIILMAVREDGKGKRYEIFMDKNNPGPFQTIQTL